MWLVSPGKLWWTIGFQFMNRAIVLYLQSHMKMRCG
jgi:hypothetical protein